MENTIKLLASIAEELDNQGLSVLASRVDSVANNALNIKTAQYLGVQGYAIRNSRCWSNCYRKKRVENPTKAAQQVWTECHKEYVESINNDGSKWDKYADSKYVFVKTASVPEEKYKELDKQISNIIDQKIKSGLDVGNAVFSSIEEVSESPYNQAITSSNELLDIASEIVANVNLSNKLTKAAEFIIKEAGFFDGIGNAVGNAWNGAKFDYNIGSNLGNVDKAINSVVQALTQMNSSKQNLLSFLQTFKPRTPQQQQSLQTAIQGIKTFNFVEPSAVNQKWQKIRQAITMGTSGQTAPIGANSTETPTAANSPTPPTAGVAGASPEATSVPSAMPTKAPKGNNVPMPPDVKDYLSKLPMNQLQRIINDAKHMRTAYNINRIKESQVPPVDPVEGAPLAPLAGPKAKPRAVQDQIHFLRDLPPNVRQFLEGLNADQLQAVLNDLQAEKHAWASVDKRRNFVR